MTIIVSFALFGLWTIICVLLGASMQYRKNRGEHPAALLTLAVDQLNTLTASLRGKKPQDTKPETIRLSVDGQGIYYWNESKIEDTALPALLQAAAGQTPQPELHIRGDKAVRYERVAQAMAAAQQAGVRKIGFITEPKE